MKPKAFVIDVDGCMTDGRMWYTKNGKVMKAFGADDHDALSILVQYLSICFVTADKIGYPITKKRIVDDMGFCLDLVPMKERVAWIEQRYGLKNTIYMGDGILDPPIFEKVSYAICPADGFYQAMNGANYVTIYSGGHRAVADACAHIKEKFFV